MPSSMPARLAFGDVVIDFGGRRLLRGGVEQALEPKAFAVLTLLANEPGRVFARDAILDAVWGHRHVTPGVLNRIVTLLRHALGEDAHSPRYLHTVHGVGYRFDLPTTAVESPAPTPTVSADTTTAPAVPEPMPSPPRADGRAQPRALRFGAYGLLALLFAALAFVGWRQWPRTEPVAPPAPPPPASPAERRIAVLPLVNASGDAQQQFFSDGLSENLIDALSRFDGLEVIGRTSAFQFRDSKDDSATIGRKLGVSYLLAGSVQRVGEMVRINASLTRADDGSTLWAEHYDRPYKDLFALQDDIAHAVAGALHAKLVPTGFAAKQSDRPPSGSIEAYNAYMKSQQAHDNDDRLLAIQHAAEAVRLDPAYAIAWAQMSISSSLQGRRETDPEKANAAYRNGRTLAEKALQLAPELGRAHAALGMSLLGPDLDPQRALAEFRRAVQLAPEDNRIHGGLSQSLTVNGKIREAAKERYHFLSDEPLVTFNYFSYAQMLMALGELDEAERYIRIGQELSGSAQSAPYWRNQLAVLRGDARTALETARQMPAAERDLYLAYAAQVGADRTAADAAVENFLKAHPAWGDVQPYDLALLHALHGDAAKTVEWLERAWARNPANVLFVLRDPFILRFRDDPRFIAFCRKVGLPDPDRSEALSIDQIRAQLADRR